MTKAYAFQRQVLLKHGVLPLPILFPLHLIICFGQSRDLLLHIYWSDRKHRPLFISFSHLLILSGVSGIIHRLTLSVIAIGRCKLILKALKNWTKERQGHGFAAMWSVSIPRLCTLCFIHMVSDFFNVAMSSPRCHNWYTVFCKYS